MRQPRRVALVAALAILGSGFAIVQASSSGLPTCSGTTIAVDPPGDDAYAGQTGTGLESSAGDIVSVATSLADGRSPAKFVTRVRDLVDTGPANFDLEVMLDLVTEAGKTVRVLATRSQTMGTTATIDGSAAGVWVSFDNARDTITVTGPRTAFASAKTVTLSAASTRYSSGAVLSPLADEAAGTCNLVLVKGYKAPKGLDASGLPVSMLVIDTGVNGKHPEFGDNQIFAWWDFSGQSRDQTPGTDTWLDTDRDGQRQGDRDDPFDEDGHGSSVASMAVGRNVGPNKTPSACPGCNLAFAKVHNPTGDTLDGSIEDAIHWGVDVLDVDVISVSIGAVAPIPALILADTYEAISYARAHGVLVLFANGNGWGNAGVPGQPGGFMPYGNSTDLLSVGADGLDSFTVTTDPEVVAVFSVNAAAAKGSAYQEISGTSFSTPYTAGVAARILGDARNCGSRYDQSPASIEQLIKYTAIDRPEVPPTFEGYGLVNIQSLTRALAVVCKGAALPTPDQLNDAYVTNVSGNQRALSSRTELLAMQQTALPRQTGGMVIGTSSPAGFADAEVYTFTVKPGATFKSVVTPGGPLTAAYDFDVALYSGAGGEFSRSELLASSGESAGIAETIQWRNTSAKPVTVSMVVYGFSVGDALPFTMTGVAQSSRKYDGVVLRVQV